MARQYSNVRLPALLLLTLAIGCVPTLSGAQPNTLDIRSDAASQPLLRRAEDLLAAGDADEAWRLLSAEEARLAGDAWFDYLLGVAALDTGRRSEAIFSLRRALTVEPRFSGARMELARAHFETGNHDLARPLFSSLLDEQPPAEVENVIRSYLAAIDAPVGDSGRTPAGGWRPFLEFTFGHDTNANGSTSDEQFLGFTLSEDNVETESPFWRLAAGFNASFPQGDRFAWYLGAQAYHRGNPDASFVDATVVSGQGGMAFQAGPVFGRVGVDAYQGWRDGEDNQSWAGADLLVGRNLGASWQVSVGLRGGALRHDESIEVLDVDRMLWTLGLGYRFARDSLLTVTGIGGEDSESESGSPYGNSRTGATLALVAPIDSGYLQLSAGSLTSDYDGLFFGGPREDTQTTLSAQFEFRDVGFDGLSIVPGVRYVDNDSDVDLYEYQRTEVGIGFRWTPR